MAKILCLLLILACVLVATAEDYTNNLDGLNRECKKYVLLPAEPRMPPSDACCGVIKKIDVQCLCSKITEEIEKLVCMEKVVYIFDFCENPIQLGSQCGSVTVPPLGQ